MRFSERRTLLTTRLPKHEHVSQGGSIFTTDRFHFLTGIPPRDPTRTQNTHMASIHDAFPSDFLKVEDLQGKNVPVTIASAKIDDIGQGQNRERKIIISLVGKSKKFVCNKTNAKVIAGLYGDQIEGWANQRITLCPREVEFQGNMVMALRVSLVAPPAAGAPSAPPPPPPPPASSSSDPDDVPF